MTGSLPTDATHCRFYASCFNGRYTVDGSRYIWTEHVPVEIKKWKGQRLLDLNTTRCAHSAYTKTTRHIIRVTRFARVVLISHIELRWPLPVTRQLLTEFITHAVRSSSTHMWAQCSAHGRGIFSRAILITLAYSNITKSTYKCN